MENDAIYNSLNQVFSGILGNSDFTLTPDTTAADVDGWDSLTHVRLILEVERYFDIKFATAELTRFRNVGELVELIQEKAS